jgi:hypothetical protein
MANNIDIQKIFKECNTLIAQGSYIDHVSYMNPEEDKVLCNCPACNGIFPRKDVEHLTVSVDSNKYYYEVIIDRTNHKLWISKIDKEKQRNLLGLLHK